MTYNLTLSAETADSLVTQVLQSDLKELRQSIQSLQSRKALEPYEQEDLDNWIELEKHLVAVIRYHSAPAQWHSI